MKYDCHSKGLAFYGCPHVPKDFFADINRIACEIGLEIEKRYSDKFEVLQCKEKFGSIRVYYSRLGDSKMVNTGKVGMSLVWIAKQEGLLSISREELIRNHDLLIPKAKMLLTKYLNKNLPKSNRILYEIKESEGVLSGQEEEEIHEILEEFRYRYPQYAHYIYLFTPYLCNCCPEDYCACEKYLKR